VSIKALGSFQSSQWGVWDENARGERKGKGSGLEKDLWII
jgi:hypothetical protein